MFGNLPFYLLGIDETDDCDVIRRAYHKKAREYHPDFSKPENKVSNHIKMIALNRAYEQILCSVHSNAQTKHNVSTNYAHCPQTYPQAGVVQHKDPAYVYYKKGVELYRAIHPSRWTAKLKSFTRIFDKVENQNTPEEVLSILGDLSKLFPRAYYYFSIVANEYRDSSWAADAREKMLFIEKSTRRYVKIIQSYQQDK